MSFGARNPYTDTDTTLTDRSPSGSSLNSMNSTPDTPRFLSQDACRTVIEQVRALGHELGREGREQVGLESQWRGDVRWGRNRIAVARDWRTNNINFDLNATNQLDPSSLEAMVQLSLQRKRDFPRSRDFAPPSDFAWAPDTQAYPQTHIWSDTTYAQPPEARSAIANQLVDETEQAGMLSAGYISVEARGTALHLEDGRYLYARQTLAQCSLTVRDPQGTGSGWAGCSSYDWGRINAQKLAEIALDKCLRSRHPVRIEPGRYTLIMEPQATFDFASTILRDGLPQFMGRQDTEGGSRQLPMPFRAQGDEVYASGQYESPVVWHKTRIGERVLDERISITFDPLDPDLGIIPFTDNGDPYEPVTWIDHGMLTNLSYDRQWAMNRLHQATGKPNSGAFRLDVSGSTVSVDEMIATTKRGLLVTRFWGLSLVDQLSMLFNGLTRDGLWLIENGKISHPVMNLRFTESPLFAFNQVEQLGVPVPVFSPEIPALAPPIKVRDFSFTSLIDAV